MADTGSYYYTTADELAYLRSVAERYNVAQLEQLRASYQQRTWCGRGMLVDRERVLAELDALIGCARAVAQGTVLTEMNR